MLRQRRAEREAHEFNTMSELSKSISKLIAVIHVKTGDDGKMFGSVTSGSIADQLKTQFDITLDKKKIHLEQPLKTLGEHEVQLRLHPEVVTSMKVRLESDNPTAQADAAAEASKEQARVTEKRGSRRPDGKADETKVEKGKEAKPKRAEKK